MRYIGIYYISKGGDWHVHCLGHDSGHTETIILRQLLYGDSYGYQINKAIQDATGNRYELKEATLYTAFRRLEQAGCILSYWGMRRQGAAAVLFHHSSGARRHQANVEGVAQGPGTYR